MSIEKEIKGLNCGLCKGRGWFYYPQTDNIEEVHAIWEDMDRDEFDPKDIKNCKMCNSTGKSDIDTSLVNICHLINSAGGETLFSCSALSKEHLSANKKLTFAYLTWDDNEFGRILFNDLKKSLKSFKNAEFPGEVRTANVEIKDSEFSRPSDRLKLPQCFYHVYMLTIFTYLEYDLIANIDGCFDDLIQNIWNEVEERIKILSRGLRF